MPDGGDVIRYRIDRDDRLIFVNEAWAQFAADNEARFLSRAAVLSRRLWEFIADDATRHVHQVLAARVRIRRRPVALPFRCDSPSVRRYLTMEIVPEAESSIEYCCTVQRIETRAPLLFQEHKDWRGRQLLRMCSWCKKVDAGGNHWVEVEDAVAALKLFERKLMPEISHTMCDACLRDFEDRSS